MQELTNKVAVVTGAGSGIGLAIAAALSAEGMRVLLADLEADSLAAAERQLVAAGADPGDVLTQVTDVSIEADVDALADLAFATWDEVDLLVNNAGVFVGGFLWERPAADLEFVLGVNLWGILHGIRAFVPRMLAQGTEGHIVNTCSIAGLLGSPYAGPYGISKFAALAATEALAADLVAVGSSIGVTALCPGVVATDIATGSERHRPAHLAAPPTDDQSFVNEVLIQVTADGIEPADVGLLVVGAIRDQRFLLLTHPHHADAIVERATQLATGVLPDRGEFT